MRLFLFLDFDGVLHRNADRYDSPFLYMDNFCNALRRSDPQSKVEIVISSTWRNSETIEQLRAHFPKDIAQRILGVTPSLADYEVQVSTGDLRPRTSQGDFERLESPRDFTR